MPEFLRAILADWFAFAASPRKWRRERKLRAIRFERELLVSEYREARLAKQRQRQSKLLQRLGELLKEELALTPDREPTRTA